MNEEYKSIDDVDTTEFRINPGYRFIFGILSLFILFLVPIPVDGQVTILFDLISNIFVERFGIQLSWISLGLGIMSAFFTILSLVNSYNKQVINPKRFDLSYWETTFLIGLTRIIGTFFLIILAFRIGPEYFHPPMARQLWDEFLPIILIILPGGAIVVNMVVNTGGLDFIGTFARPLMKPLFNLPGKSVLDSLASIIGSSVVGLYVTYDVFNTGGYNKRNVYILVTCFASANIGTVVLAATLLNIMHLFPLIVLSWLLSLSLVAIITVRLPPLNRIPEEYIESPKLEVKFKGSIGDYYRLATTKAMQKAESTTLTRSVYTGLTEGIGLVSIVIGVVMAIIYPLFLVFENTQLLETLAQPITGIIELLGIPNSETVAIAVISSIGLDILPALVASGPGVQHMSGFFIVVFSMSIVVYIANIVPIAVDLFQDVPIRVRELIIVLSIRILLLLPIVAAITHTISLLGFFD